MAGAYLVEAHVARLGRGVAHDLGRARARVRVRVRVRVCLRRCVAHDLGEVRIRVRVRVWCIDLARVRVRVRVRVRCIDLCEVYGVVVVDDLERRVQELRHLLHVRRRLGDAGRCREMQGDAGRYRPSSPRRSLPASSCGRVS